MAYQTELTWTQVDPNTLSEGDYQRYQDYKTAYKAMKEAKARFEGDMQVNAPEGMCLKFGYNFGKLSIALDKAQVVTKKATSGTQSLSAFLAMQNNSGAHV